MGRELFVFSKGEFRLAGNFGYLPEFGVRNKAAEILIAETVFGEQSKASRVRTTSHVDFRPDESSDSLFHGCHMKTWRTVNAMHVG